MKKNRKEAEVLLVQKHQQSKANQKIGAIESDLYCFQDMRKSNMEELEDLESQLDSLMAAEGIFFDESNGLIEPEVDVALEVDEKKIERLYQPEALESISVDGLSWDDYISSVYDYADGHGIDLSGDPFETLLTESQRAEITKRINNDLTYKGCRCDKFDYMIAGTCGMIAGLVDVLFVGLPGEGLIGKGADKAVDGVVENIAKILGWKGPRDGSDPKASAIGFLEKKFKVNYDQTHSNAKGKRGTDGKVSHLTPGNHHVKSLAHSPDLVGLLFSILNQFNSTSTFVSDGRLITIDTESFELQGGNFAAKVFSGFCNWLGHLASDMAGSSGSSGRGTGIPIPFYSLLQFLNFGAFGQHKDTFAKVAVKVFEQGYDFRHGTALAVPVVISEMLTRVAWSFKQRLYHNQDWKDCIPSASNAELRRMLLVAHGTLCIVDGADAGLRSGGNVVAFMLHANLFAWARFGTIAVKELRAWYKVGDIDIDAANEHLENEYRKLLME